MPDVHIIPDGDQWSVKREDGGVVSTHDSQSDAEQSAKSWLDSNGGGEVKVHRDEGEFSRIRKSDSV